MLEIRVIDSGHKTDINIPNEPFALFGQMVPSYIDKQWGYGIELLPEDVSL